MSLSAMEYRSVVIFSMGLIFNAFREIGTVDGKLIVIPRNTDVKINDSTYLNCSTSLHANHIHWHHDRDFVYTAIGIFEPYTERFSVEINASTGTCNLVIRSVQPSDAGTYECAEDEGTGDKSSVQLIVLNTSGQTKDSSFIAQELTRNIEAIGFENVVQVITDSAANCVAAPKKVREIYPSVACSPCAAHCLDLLLEDVGKLPWAASIIADGHSVIKFITTHQASLAFFRAHSTLELLKPGETRFASYFIMLQRLQETKDALQETVMDRDYKKWMSGPKHAERGTSVTEIILDNRFWDQLLKLTSICEPFVSLLRMIDGVIPCVGKIYWKMFQADQDIDSSTLDAAKKAQVKALVAARWKMMHTDLHSAGFVLDPEYRIFLQHENDEVISGFHAMIERVHNGDVQSQVKAIQQHSIYRAGHGLFAREVATAVAK